jgi:hypothetical protein
MERSGIACESATASIKKAVSRVRGSALSESDPQSPWPLFPLASWHWQRALPSLGPARDRRQQRQCAQTLHFLFSSLNWMTVRFCSKFWHIFKAYHMHAVCNQFFVGKKWNKIYSWRELFGPSTNMLLIVGWLFAHVSSPANPNEANTS